MKVTNQYIEQFGEAFHSGLRKGVDSKFSIIAWNVIRILPPPVWQWFCEYMTTASFKIGDEFDCQHFKKLLQDWDSKKFSEQNDERKKQVTTSKIFAHRIDRHIVMIFDAAVSSMPDDDAVSLYEWLCYGFGGE